MADNVSSLSAERDQHDGHPDRKCGRGLPCDEHMKNDSILSECFCTAPEIEHARQRGDVET